MLHLALPVRVTASGAFAVVEQDSTEDVLQCARVVLETPQGAREERPEFGLPDPLFAKGGVDAATVEAVLADWEPRATIDARVDNVDLDAGVSRLIARIAARGVE